MANIIDYLDWRGDIAVRTDGFNEVDGLLLAELSFCEFEGIVPPDGTPVPLWEAGAAYVSRHPPEKGNLGVLVPHQIPEMCARMARSRRFGPMRLSRYEAVLDEAREEQFAALCIDVGDGSRYVSFRGTDDTIVGWKEDLNLGFLETIPSQRAALDYLTRAAEGAAALRVGGHSKGGNLAVYAAVRAPEAVQRRIVGVYNNDGPGFLRDLSATPGHARVASRIRTVVPQSSVVGRLLAHERCSRVVRSAAAGLAQHDGFTWEVRGTRFVCPERLTGEEARTERELEQWTASLSPEDRRAFADALYEVLTAAGARTLSELTEENLRGAAGMLKTVQNIDGKSRRTLVAMIRLLLRLNTRSVVQDMQEAGEREAATLRRRFEELLERRTTRS